MDQNKMHPAPRRHPLRKLMRQFGRDENGSMIIFSIYLLVVMLILGGMAVDFMRFESRRSSLQGVSDRSALACANLRNASNKAQAEAIAVDYFVKSGMEQYLVGQPIVQDETNYRSCEIQAEMPLSTFFLKLVGINKLQARSASKAIEGVGNVEISLVVDISGSMKEFTRNAAGALTTTTKMAALQAAATAFTDAVLHDDYAGKISMSLVPYSQHVNVGPTLFGRLNTATAGSHGFSHCVEFPDSAFSSQTIDTTYTYTQGQNLQTNYGGWGTSNSQSAEEVYNVRTDTVCPRHWYERITFVSQNRTAINLQIAALQPRAGTSIFLGLKWGVALLDKSARALVAGGQEGEFIGRPADYPTVQNPDSRTEKFVVLMTDGDNQWSDYLHPEYYDTPSEIAHWNDYNLGFWRDHYADTPANGSSWTYTRYSAPAYTALYGITGQSDGDLLTRNLCTAAKNAGITIFAIAFEATPAGQTLMSECASSPSHYFKSSGGELTAIFQAIAAQITDLRLTL